MHTRKKFEFSLRPVDEDGAILILQRNHFDLICPFGQDDPACGSWCPLFGYRRNFTGEVVTLACGQSGSPSIVIPQEDDKA